MTILLNRKNTKKKVLISLLSLCLIAGGYLLLAYFNKLPPFAATAYDNPNNKQVINLKRSEAEKKASESLQANPALKTQNQQTDTPAAPTDTTSGKTVVNVLLTNVGINNGTVSASGFVTNLAEAGGSCEFVFTNGDAKVSKISDTLVNSTSTTCKTVTFPASELSPSGTWKVVINYQSNDATGVSNTKELTK